MQIFGKLLNLFSQLANFLCRSLLIGLRPLLGPASCKFYPSCGNYALQQFNEQPFHKAVWLIARRLLRCR